MVAVERVRVRQAGGVQFVDLIVGVSRTLALDRVAALKDRIEAAVRAEYPKAELSVTTEPRALDGESVLERVMVIARNRSLAVHHVTVHAIGAKLSVSLDLEVDGGAGARRRPRYRDRARRRRSREEIGPDVEVETHIEPLQPHASRAATRRRSGSPPCATRSPDRRPCASVGEVHDVRVRRTDGGEIVNFHCQVDPLLTVAEVHERVDDVERALRARFPSIKRVIGHAEPRRVVG